MSNDEEINELLAEIDLNDDEPGTNAPLSTVELDSPAPDDGSIATGHVETGDNEPREPREDDAAGSSEIEDDVSAAHIPPARPQSAQARPAALAANGAVTSDSAATGATDGSVPRPPIPDEVKEAAVMAATVTREAAADVAKELSKISNQAQSIFRNVWQQFDPLAGSGKGQAGGDSDGMDVTQRFGISNEAEKVLESFRCTLIQTYAPSDNTFTPIKAIGFTGCFHILDAHIAFEFDNVASNGKPIVIPLAEVDKVERDPANGGSLVCRLVGGRIFVVGRFLNGTLELDSAELLLRGRQ